MENKNNMISDEKLEQVSGGAGARPNQRFQEDDLVKITHTIGNSTKYSYGRVSDCEYDEELGQWTYQVELGHYKGTRWVTEGYNYSNTKYYPQSRLTRWTTTSGYYVGDIES